MNLDALDMSKVIFKIKLDAYDKYEESPSQTSCCLIMESDADNLKGHNTQRSGHTGQHFSK